ncbi:hypothetical protein GA0115246_104905 [Streptomyces sp. SolWspMP-sol7th]|nr:hypothetical protein GA0115246_104905 [Streptomyces sp. SolWspMP-sol7th]
MRSGPLAGHLSPCCPAVTERSRGPGRTGAVRRAREEPNAPRTRIRDVSPGARGQRPSPASRGAEARAGNSGRGTGLSRDEYSGLSPATSSDAVATQARKRRPRGHLRQCEAAGSAGHEGAGACRSRRGGRAHTARAPPRGGKGSAPVVRADGDSPSYARHGNQRERREVTRELIPSFPLLRASTFGLCPGYAATASSKLSGCGESCHAVADRKKTSPKEKRIWRPPPAPAAPIRKALRPFRSALSRRGRAKTRRSSPRYSPRKER